jgi:hypothetical protein
MKYDFNKKINTFPLHLFQKSQKPTLKCFQLVSDLPVFDQYD